MLVTVTGKRKGKTQWPLWRYVHLYKINTNTKVAWTQGENSRGMYPCHRNRQGWVLKKMNHEKEGPPEISGLQFLKWEGDTVRKLKIVPWIWPGFYSLIHRTWLLQPWPCSWVPSGLSLDRGTLAPSVRALIFQGHSKINTRDPPEGSGDRGTQPGLAVMG